MSRPVAGGLMMAPPEGTGGGNTGRSNCDDGRVSAHDAGYADGAAPYSIFSEP